MLSDFVTISAYVLICHTQNRELFERVCKTEYRKIRGFDKTLWTFSPFLLWKIFSDVTSICCSEIWMGLTPPPDVMPFSPRSVTKCRLILIMRHFNTRITLEMFTDTPKTCTFWNYARKALLLITICYHVVIMSRRAEHVQARQNGTIKAQTGKSCQANLLDRHTEERY